MQIYCPGRVEIVTCKVELILGHVSLGRRLFAVINSTLDI